MTLHDTTLLVKKAGIGSVIGIITILVIVIIVRISVSVWDAFHPPKKAPPTQIFGVLPPLEFPESVVNNNFTYEIHTIAGELPTDLPDRLSVFPITENAPNFLNLESAKSKVTSLDFVSEDRKTVPEIKLDDPYYEWDEPTGFNRKMIMNINSFDFKMTSNYLSSLLVLSGRFIKDEADAIRVAQNFLNLAGLMPTDIDLSKTNTKDNPAHFVSYPKLYSIQSGPEGNVLVDADKLSQTHVIRVDFYQKDVEYDLNTGFPEEKVKKPHLKLPILYSKPPYSTMSFWIASGPRIAMVTQAFFTHKNIDFTITDATYAIKTAEQAFDELKGGKAYIASQWGSDNKIIITDVYLAYYLGEDSKGYLMPIYVFEGKNGFFAYVSAIL